MFTFCLRVGDSSHACKAAFGHCSLFPDKIKEEKVKFDKRGRSKPSGSHLKSFPESWTQQFLLYTWLSKILSLGYSLSAMESGKENIFNLAYCYPEQNQAVFRQEKGDNEN